jgi:hypothetical protein
MGKKSRRNRRTVPVARKQPMSRARFERELTKVVDGDPAADPEVRAFFNDFVAAMGVKAAVAHPRGIALLREHPEGGETP